MLTKREIRGYRTAELVPLDALGYRLNQALDSVEGMAKSLACYARLRRNASPDYAFLGNDARDALARYLEVDVKELEPGTDSALRLLRDL